jgi:syntaxin-binding protein 1
VLFITDRSMDLAAPFLHEFTYQAMCNDLLPIEDGSKYKWAARCFVVAEAKPHGRHTFRNEQGVMEDTEAILNDDDKVWVDVRHMHMKEALDTLVAAFRAFNQEHGQSTGSSINDLKDMLANLPGMKESKEKVGRPIHIGSSS